ncbi:MAG: cadherin repeat domain-containing protein [Planctomycetaceae bacterium]|nr:cadherin repeat domain-containing protein [Planctomycetaceae bacterium]
MLVSNWLSRWSFHRKSQSKPRKARRRSVSPIAARAQWLEPRVLLTATPVGGEFRVNTYTTGAQRTFTESPQSVAMDADGDFVVTWTSYPQDGSSYGVYAQRFVGQSPPVINPQTFTIAENRPVGHVVGTVVATEPDAGQALTYATTAGNAGNVFAINPTTGVITVASATINFEALNQYNLTVQATDNGAPALSNSATVTINVTDLNEAPTFLAPTTFTISENRPVGQFVGDVNTSDAEGNTVTYSLVGDDPNAQFSINSATGVIAVAQATIDFEATPQFLLSVRATDNGTPSNNRTQTITINLTNIVGARVPAQPATARHRVANAPATAAVSGPQFAVHMPPATRPPNDDTDRFSFWLSESPGEPTTLVAPPRPKRSVIAEPDGDQPTEE